MDDAPSKVSYKTLDGANSTAYLDGPVDVPRPGAEQQHWRYWGEDKYTDARVMVRWTGTEWLQVAE